MSTILITGATGTIGSQLAANLVEMGETVRGATRNPDGAQLPKGVTPTRFDYADAQSVRDALRDVDRVFLLAPAGMEQQTELESALLIEAKKAGVAHIVLLSAMGASEDSPHGQMEVAVANSGLGYTILKPTFFAQNFSSYVRDSIKNASEFSYPSGDGQVAYIDIRDIADVAAKVLNSPAAHNGKSYDLTGPELLNHSQIAEKLSTTTGRKITYNEPTLEAYRASLIEAGTPGEVADLFTNLYGVVVRNNYAAQISGAVQDICGRPATAFATFANDHKNHWI